MQIKMIWGIHNTESLPELLFAMDENSIEQNPHLFDKKYEDFKNDSYYENVRIMWQEIENRSLRIYLLSKQVDGKRIRLKSDMFLKKK